VQAWNDEAWAWVETLVLSPLTVKAATRLADCPVLGVVAHLQLRFRHEEALVALLACPHLTSLAALDLGYTRLGDAGLTALAACPHLTGLVSLELGHNRIGDAGLAALANAPYLNRLVSLDLRKNRFGSAGFTGAGVAALARTRGLPALRRLILCESRVGD